MKNLRVAIPQNSQECRLALNFVYKIFGKKNNVHFFYYNKLNYKKFENIITIRYGKKIVGAVIIVYKKMFFYNSKIKSAFLTDVCIDKAFRGKGLSRILLENCFKILKKKKCVVAIVIARRAVDYYYSKFNFWGVSSYPKIYINNKLKKNIIVKDVIHKKVNKNDLVHISKLHKNTYGKIFGYFERDYNFWNYSLFSTKGKGINFFKLIIKNKIIGYVVYKENNIYEISSNNKINYLKIIAFIMNKINSNNIILNCNYSHEITRTINDFDTVYKTRSSLFGGHMVKVINENIMKKYYEKYIKKKIKKNFANNRSLTLFFFKKNKFFSNKLPARSQDFYINYLDQI